MTIDFERQELRALALLPIRHLPAYAADWSVTCRVGKAVAAPSALTPWSALHQLVLEITLSEP
jgi:hypothetical protein